MTSPLPTATQPVLEFRAAAEFLAALDSDWAALVDAVGVRPSVSQSTTEPYQHLIHAIAHQQLHGKAAEAILKRFKALYSADADEIPSAAAIIATDPELIRACGFSTTKVATIMGIAEHTIAGTVPTRAEAETLDNDALITRLTTLRGVGRWTVEIFLMHALHRPDILPVDDFGVREGWRLLKQLDSQPKPKALAMIGSAWSPHRSTAAWYLWRAVDRAKAAQREQVTR